MPNISPSLLKTYIKDPYYMYQKHILKSIDAEKTTALSVGSMVDAYLTEGFEIFVKKYIPVSRRNLKNPPSGYTEVSKTDYDKAIKIATSVFQTGVYKSIIDGKYTAQQHLYHPYKCGIFDKLSGIVDWYKIEEDGTCIIIDLKTTTKIEPQRFKYEIDEYEYYLQLAFYGMLLRLIYPAIKITKYYILAVENKEPYRVKLYRLRNEEMFGQELRISSLLQEIDNIKEYLPKEVSFNNEEII